MDPNSKASITNNSNPAKTSKQKVPPLIIKKADFYQIMMTLTLHHQIPTTNLDRQDKPLGHATYHLQVHPSFPHKIASHY